MIKTILVTIILLLGYGVCCLLLVYVAGLLYEFIVDQVTWKKK